MNITDYKIDFIGSAEDIPLLIERCADLVKITEPLGLDTETLGPRDRKEALLPSRGWVRLVQIGTKHHAIVVDLHLFRPDPSSRSIDWALPGARELKALLEGANAKAIANAAFDINFLAFEGVSVGGAIFDVCLAARIINDGSGAPCDLESITKRILKIELDKTYQKYDYKTAELAPAAVNYAGLDAIVLPRLCGELKSRLQGAATVEGSRYGTLWDIFKLEMAICKPVAQMCFNGFHVNRKKALELQAELTAAAATAQKGFLLVLDAAIERRNPDDPEKRIPRNPDGTFNTRAKDSGSIRLGTKKLKGFNPSSVQQMLKALMDAGIHPPFSPKTGKPVLDQKLLKFMQLEAPDEFPLVEHYLEMKKAETDRKHIETIVGAMDDDDRVHASYNQIGAETGRMSCKNINLQQVPSRGKNGKKFRSIFEAPEGFRLVGGDASQVELRVGAEISGEEAMINEYNRTDEEPDLHARTAENAVGVEKYRNASDEDRKSYRAAAKCLNFGLIYGAGKATIQLQAVSNYNLLWSLEEAANMRGGFLHKYKILAEWQREQGTATTTSVWTLLGRRRLATSKRSEGYSSRINHPIQGTAGDILKLGIKNLDRELNARPGEARLIAAVHDELILEVVEDHAEEWATRLKKCMEDAGNDLMQLVPIIVDKKTGQTWADAH